MMKQSNPDNTRAEVLRQNIAAVRQGIAEAAERAGRQPDTIRLMAVTKTVSPQDVNTAIGEGITLLGENRVQEFLSKREEYLSPHEVHFIGHLQTNKVRQIVGEAAMIQSVDSVHLAEEISRVSQKKGVITPILLEVNIGRQETKGGILTEHLPSLLERVSALPALRTEGLMAIPPQENAAYYFAKMQELFIDISSKKVDNVYMSTLSMGMSQDYKEAIQYGSTLVRIGTGLFGGRK